ncbi:ABATE domain-containing protein [Providencia huaxiensis]|nr:MULTISPECIES: ABATE domain-containing protein [Providencia]MBN6363359.1 ABATE domain-containing protein [Providencia huaxiensis]
MPNTIQASPLFLSGNVALDFINTQYSENGIDKDVLANNQSVISWLEQVGQLKESPNVIPIDLMVISKQLRTELKNIIDQLLNGQPPKLSAFNHLLDEVQFLEQLDWDNDNKKFILLKKC